MTSSSPPAFMSLIDLASEAFGGRTLEASDDFFAEKENLLRSGRGIYIPEKYTDRGKWMDGWESRRRRGPGNDWCIIKLGAPGIIRGVDIDTNHFLGNHPTRASVEGLNVEETPTDDLKNGPWVPLLPESPLNPGSQHLLPVASSATFTHVRLSIYPDGGVARFRVYGDVQPRWNRHPDDEARADFLREGEVDLIAARNGGLALSCTDMFFGPMNNLLLPGQARHMGQGWETRRKRAPGHDSMILRLGAPGTVTFAEIDTMHFKGNYPDKCSLEGVYLPGATAETLAQDATPWAPLLAPTSLQAHHPHRFRKELLETGALTHIRFHIFPDGGVARLRLYGLRSEETS